MLKRLQESIKSNPRLRAGVWLIAAILWVHGVLVLRDAAETERGQYASAARRAARVEAQGQQDVWLKRAEEARILRTKLEGELGQAETPGLAQARYQDLLNNLASQARIARSQITVTLGTSASSESDRAASAAAPADDLWRVSARLDFEFAADNLTEFLRLVAQQRPRSVVETLIVRKEPAPRVELVLNAYFQRPRSAAGPQPPPKPIGS